MHTTENGELLGRVILRDELNTLSIYGVGDSHVAGNRRFGLIQTCEQRADFQLAERETIDRRSTHRETGQLEHSLLP